MSIITPQQFNTAARLMSLSYEWQDDGNKEVENGEVLVDGIPWVQWNEKEFQTNLQAIQERARLLLVFPADRIDPLRVYEHTEDFSFDDPPQVDQERIAATLMEVLPLPSKSCQETAFASYALRTFEELGFTVEIDDLPAQVAEMPSEQKAEFYCNNGQTAPTSGNLIALSKGNPDLPVWNLSFHLDTNQLTFVDITRDGDTIKPGPGTPLGADDKAGFAIIVETIRALQALEIPHGDIRIVGLVGEEQTAGGAQLIKPEAFQGDILVSIDGAAFNEIGQAAPTIYGGNITVRTKTSHPALIDQELAVDACAVGRDFLVGAGFQSDGHPFDDPNVILMSHFQSCGVEEENDGKPQTTSWGVPLAAPRNNTVPPFFTANWQMRSLRGEQASARMAEELKKTLDGVCQAAARGRTSVECEITGTDEPGLVGYLVDEYVPGIQLMLRSYGDIAGQQPLLAARQFGGFNGNFVKLRFDKEMILLDTGASQIHTDEETMNIPHAKRVARALLTAMINSYRYQQVE